MHNSGYPEIIRLVFNYGVYSKPFVTHYREFNKEGEWLYFLKAMELFWQGEREMALQQMEIGIIESDSEKEKLLLHMNMMNILVQEKKIGWRSLFEDFKKNQYKIPPFLREEIVITLKNIGGLKKVKETRVWGEAYKKNLYTYAFVMLAEARESIRAGDIKTAVAKYCRSFRVSEVIPHPSGMVVSANNAAWYLRDINKSAAGRMSEISCHSMGKFFEPEYFKFYVMHSYYEIINELKSCELFRFVEIMKYVFPYMAETVRKKYELFMESTYYLIADAGENVYEADRNIVEYIKSRTANISSLAEEIGMERSGLSRLINFKTKKVNSRTLKNIILNIGVDLDEELPHPFVNEIYKIHIESAYDDSLIKMFDKSPADFRRNFISYFSAYIGREKYVSFLCRKGEIRKLFDEVSCVSDMDEYLAKKSDNPRNQIKKFVSGYSGMNPLELARKELFAGFLEEVDEEAAFIRFYCEMDESDRGYLDIFVRNYKRYSDIKGKRIKAPEDVAEFVSKYGLKQTPTALAIYCVDNKNSRKKMASIMKAMI